MKTASASPRFHAARLALAAALLLAAPSARAQLVNDGATAVLNNTVTNVTGTLTVGTNGSFTMLIVTNGARLTNSADGRIGFNGTARSNRVVVTGANSAWRPALNLFVGDDGSDNLLLITNGGRVHGNSSVIGRDGSNNLVIVNGGASRWTNSSSISAGHNGSFNHLVVTNDGRVDAGGMLIGNGTLGANNQVTVTGFDSIIELHTNTVGGGALYVGSESSLNRLVISSFGTVVSHAGFIGQDAGTSNNTVLVTGPGSSWTNFSRLEVGATSHFSELAVSNAARVSAGNLFVGFEPTSTGNFVRVTSGGSIRVPAGTTDVRRGTFILDNGVFETAALLLINGASSQFIFNGGSLLLTRSVISNGTPFVAGNGTTPAALALLGNDTNIFAHGLRLSARSTLLGDSRIHGHVTNGSGGTISPGSSAIGQLVITGHLALASGSTNRFEIHPAGGARDQITGLAGVTYGGTLVVTNLGGALTNGSRFQLFSAASYAGGFDALALPPLASGLVWVNKLLIDGSLEVVTPSPAPYTTLVPFGANWKYLDNGSDQGAAWRAPAFDDSSWSNGVAELGYGDGDEATVVSFGTNAAAKHITTYFRHAFAVPDPSGFTSVLARVVRDDGVLIFLNGVELFRDNLPAGPVDYLTLAPAIADETVPVINALVPVTLLPGTNVLAVEIHQADGISSDISFNLELIGVPVLPLPPVTRVWSGAGANNLWSNPANWQGVIPQTGDDVVFPAGAARPVNVNNLTNLIINSLRLETNGLNLQGGALTLQSSITNAAASGTNSVTLTNLSLLGDARIAVPSAAARLVLPPIAGGAFDLTCDNAGRLEIPSVSGSGALAKSGPGVLQLNSPQQAGSHVVHAGTLMVAGGTVSVMEINGGATLAGTGSPRDVHVRSGVVSPGHDSFTPVGLGSLSIQNLNFDPAPAATTLRIDLAANGQDSVVYLSTVNLGGAALELAVSTNLAVGAERTILFAGNATNRVTGTFLGLPQGALLRRTDGHFRITYTNGSGGDVTLTRVALTNVWTGAGGDALWSNPANWQDHAAPGPGDTLVFPAAAQRTMQNDYPSNTTFEALIFEADGYTLAGEALSVTSRLAAHQAAGTNRIVAALTQRSRVTVMESNAVLSLEGGVRFASVVTVTNFGRIAITGGLDSAISAFVNHHGPGTLDVAGGGAITGSLTVVTGTVHLTGDCPRLDIVLQNGSFRGAGRVETVVQTVAGIARLSAGSAPGQAGLLETTRLTINSNVTVEVELRGAVAGAGYDQIQVTGTNLPVQLTNAPLALTLAYNPPPMTAHRLINNTGSNAIRGTFGGLPEGALLTNQGAVFAITYAGGDGNDCVLTRVNDLMDLTAATVQPDGTLLLQGLGLPGWTFIIECATNLAPPAVWTPVSTNVADALGVFTFTDGGTTNHPARYYRARAAAGP